jgi:hypothetical protein
MPVVAERLWEAASLEEYIALKETPPDFSEYVEYLRKTLGVGKEEFFSRAVVSSSYGHEILRGNHAPPRKKVIQFAFGLRLNLEQTQKLLWVAGSALLYENFPFDACIMDSLRKRHNTVNANIALSDLDLPLLFE